MPSTTARRGRNRPSYFKGSRSPSSSLSTSSSSSTSSLSTSTYPSTSQAARSWRTCLLALALVLCIKHGMASEQNGAKAHPLSAPGELDGRAGGNNRGMKAGQNLGSYLSESQAARSVPRVHRPAAEEEKHSQQQKSKTVQAFQGALGTLPGTARAPTEATASGTVSSWAWGPTRGQPSQAEPTHSDDSAGGVWKPSPEGAQGSHNGGSWEQRPEDGGGFASPSAASSRPGALRGVRHRRLAAIATAPAAPAAPRSPAGSSASGSKAASSSSSSVSPAQHKTSRAVVPSAPTVSAPSGAKRAPGGGSPSGVGKAPAARKVYAPTRAVTTQPRNPTMPSSLQPPTYLAPGPSGGLAPATHKDDVSTAMDQALHSVNWELIDALRRSAKDDDKPPSTPPAAASIKNRRHAEVADYQKKAAPVSLLDGNGGPMSHLLLTNDTLSQYPQFGGAQGMLAPIPMNVSAGSGVTSSSIALAEEYRRMDLAAASAAAPHPGFGGGEVYASTRPAIPERRQDGPCMGKKCKCSKRDDCYGGAVCIKGTCACPILPSLGETLDPRMGCREERPADANSEWCIMSLANFTHAHSHRFPSRMFVLESAMLKQRPDLDLPYLADWSSCAIVGSSDSLLKKKAGTEIDKHSAVIRFNDAPTKQHAAHVGSKTTVRIQNVEYCGFKEKSTEILLHYTPPNHMHKDFCPRRGARKLTNHFLEYETRYFHSFLHKPYSKFPRRDPAGGRSKLSGGFFGVALALHLCGTVDIYGFSQSDRHYYKKTRNVGGVHPFPVRHNWQMERACLALLGKGLWKPRVAVKN